MDIVAPNFPPHFIHRFRFWGIRALNWEFLSHELGSTQDEHLEGVNSAPWLHAAQVNIVIGPNGGGKTTTLDVVRAISDHRVWPSLPRENPRGQYFSGFEFEGGDWSLKVKFKLNDASTAKDATFRIRMYEISVPWGHVRDPMPLYERSRAGKRDKDETVGWERKIREQFAEKQTPQVYFCPPASQHPEEDNPAIIDILNRIWPSLQNVEMAGIHELNVVESPFKRVGNRTRIAVSLKDDPVQRQHLDVKDLPLGWRHYAYVIWSLRQAPANSIVLLDEPDRVLHPRLQRRLLLDIAAIAKEANHQIFISTHSPALINPSLIEPLGAAVFHARGQRLSRLTHRRDVLDDLGISSADLAHTNGVIWVEGPTDRIYLNKWLRLYAEHQQRAPWIEGLNYQIAFYGGSLLKYLTLLDAGPMPDERVSIRSINRNFFLVMDSDFDEFSEDDEPVDTNAKSRLRDEASKLHLEDGDRVEAPDLTWLTSMYTIEDYLPSDHFGTWVTKKDGRTVIKGRKIALADRFRRSALTWEESFQPGSDLPFRIEALSLLIEDWQTADADVLKNW